MHCSRFSALNACDPVAGVVVAEVDAPLVEELVDRLGELLLQQPGEVVAGDHEHVGHVLARLERLDQLVVVGPGLHLDLGRLVERVELLGDVGQGVQLVLRAVGTEGQLRRRRRGRTAGFGRCRRPAGVAGGQPRWRAARARRRPRGPAAAFARRRLRTHAVRRSPRHRVSLPPRLRRAATHTLATDQ